MDDVRTVTERLEREVERTDCGAEIDENEAGRETCEPAGGETVLFAGHIKR